MAIEEWVKLAIRRGFLDIKVESDALLEVMEMWKKNQTKCVGVNEKMFF